MPEFDQQKFAAAYQAIRLADPLKGEIVAQLHCYDCLASTNQTAWEWVDQQAPAGTGILALEQTAGRGQRGHTWVSTVGGLYLSVILYPAIAPTDTNQLTISTAWGIARALREIPVRLGGTVTQIPVQIKWLNDLVLQGKKMGGILTETRMQGNQLKAAVVGVGINWQNAVPETGITLCDFFHNCSDAPIDSLEMLTALTVHGLLTGFARLHHQGIEVIVPEYNALLTYRDRSLRVNEKTGTILGINPTGDLRFQVDSDGSNEILIKPGTINLGYAL